ncbi:DUF3137 domain-containing protein [Antarctobacter sp.]|uniref:DUF3137 domain-containing protein n=1 Tax=Antarctobacter sp. TaxID=1872577 RepID=UPI002B278320|nr:DUF3137 domain-containing protein [Antarctobacter sp.]
MQFIEKSPIETGFAEVFAQRVAPKLDRLEAKRAELLKAGWRNFGITMAIGVLIGGALAIWNDLVIGIFVVVFFLIPAFAIRSSQSKKWSGEVAETVMPAVCDFLGDVQYDRKASNSFSATQAKEMGLVRGFDHAKLEDHMTGTWRGTGFEMVEAKLTTRTKSNSNSSSNESTVFQGLLFRISLPHPAPTRILIARNFGRTLNKLASFFSSDKTRGMPRIETGHVEFEKDFELHAQTPDGVLEYLPPAFLDNLTAIGSAEAEGGTMGLVAAFEGTDFWLALSRTKPFLEMAKINEPVDTITEELHGVFDDMALVRRIIDRLHG